MICHLPGLVAVLEAKTEKCVETGDRGTKGEGGRGRVGSGVSSSLRPGQGRGRGRRVVTSGGMTAKKSLRESLA